MRKNIQRGSPRNGKAIHRNPQWSHSILDAIWDDLLAVGGPNLMPIPKNPPVVELGTGAFGVAMPTVGGDLVLKMTTDFEEARFVHAAANLGMNGTWEGIVRTSEVFSTSKKLHQSGFGHPVFVYWREIAFEMGYHVFDQLAQTHSRMDAAVAKHLIGEALQALRDGDAATIPTTLRDMTNSEITRDAGAELLTLLEMGIMVTDIHQNNWGILERSPDQLVLMDPGRVVFTSEAAQLARNIPSLHEAARAAR
jgi:hypothetical protein